MSSWVDLEDEVIEHADEMADAWGLDREDAVAVLVELLYAGFKSGELDFSPARLRKTDAR